MDEVHAVFDRTYVEVISGSKQGSIGEVKEKRAKFVDSAESLIDTGRNKPFWIKNKHLRTLENHDGSLVDVNANSPKDLLGQLIQEQDLVAFPRVVNASLEMLLGNVERITDRGVVYVRPFKSSGNIPESDTFRVGKPSTLIRINDELKSHIFKLKLSTVKVDS